MSLSPKLSIVLACRNEESNIKKFLKSVLEQRYKNFELIIIDGNSTDSTLAIIKSYALVDSRIKYISERDNGVYDALNKGIRLSKGEWLYFIGADDQLYDDYVLEHVFTSEKINEFDVLVGYIWNEKQKRFIKKYCDSLDNFLNYTFNHQSMFYRRTVFDAIGLYDVQYKINSDRVFNLKWYVDPSYKKLNLDICIAKFSATGISASQQDPTYYNDLERIYSRYLGPILPSNKLYYYVNLDKQWSIYDKLKKGHIGALFDLYKLIYHGRSLIYLRHALYHLLKR